MASGNSKQRSNPEAAALLEAERADREENANVNEAIARTDQEVFSDALGDEPLEDDAGTDLEEMGEGLEGEELDEEEASSEGEVSENETPDGEEAPAEGEVEEEPPLAAQPPPPPSIPPRVLRETRERARETENELRSQLRDMQMRLDNLSRQPPPQPAAQPAQQPAAQQTAPDMFADPDGYRNWVLDQAEKRAEAKFETRFAEQRQLQQRDMEARLNDGLASAATGPRSYEFNVAYRDLTSLEKTPENAALVRRLVANPETAGQAILDWWEQTSNPDYVEYHRDQIRQTYGATRPSRGGGIQRQNGRVPMNGQQTPRHEVRLPRSLSDAAGGRSQHVSDPEMADGSEESVFAYGARR